MLREAPRRSRFEHVVLQHELAGVSPVVRDLASVVKAHHVARRAAGATRSVFVRHDFGLISADRMKPSIFPPLMSTLAATAPCGPPRSTTLEAWNGLTQSCCCGSGRHATNRPWASRGSPS